MRRLCAVAASAFFATRAVACVCFPDTVRDCERNAQAQVAFVGRVVEIGAPFRLAADFVVRLRFNATEAFRGVTVGEVHVAMPLSSCGYRFQIGKEYLVYATRAGRGSGALTTGACFGNELRESASAAISNLRGLVNRTGTASVFGFVTGDPEDLKLGLSASKPVAGVSIALHSGDQVRTAKSDGSGAFEFRDLPPGEFLISNDQSATGIRFASRKLRLAPSGCSRENFLVIPTDKP